MRALCIVVVAGVTGCFSPDYRNGDLQCSGAGECPSGLHCVAGRCYVPGGEPPATTPDFGAASDLAAASDSGGRDDLGAAPDLLSAADLAPVVVSVPPAAVFTCAGGGSSTAMSQAQLNLSLGGTIARGVVAAASGAVVTLGYFSSDTY